MPYKLPVGWRTNLQKKPHAKKSVNCCNMQISCHLELVAAGP